MKNNKIKYLIVLGVINFVFFSGCYKEIVLNYDELGEQEIESIITKQNDTLFFADNTNEIIELCRDSIKYRNVNAELESLCKDDIEAIIISEYSGSKTTACVLGSIALTVTFFAFLFFVLPAE